ncbi:Ig heavy chain Mem5-like [Notamacropus eugenii]|uniref:Ig heavy chain Mem5-like n=1 Tax=Notamacropus eugenii TaxID=9315 RepID=UPI003B67A378
MTRNLGSCNVYSPKIQVPSCFTVSEWGNFGPGTEVTVLTLEKTVLTESGGGPHQAGRTLNLKCQTSGFQFKTSKLGWYLWIPGHTPLCLTSFDSSSTDATEDRITTSRNNTGSQIFLQIKALGLRDSGQYHCARRVGNGDDRDKLVFGRGTEVTVEPGPRALLSPSVFLMRDHDAVACLIKNFYPKELNISLASPMALITAQTLILVPMANGIYSAVQIGRVGENDTVTCSVKHLGKEIHVSYHPDHTGPDPGIASEKNQSCPEQDLVEGPEQGNKLLLSVMGLRLLFMKTVAINVIFTTIAFIF